MYVSIAVNRRPPNGATEFIAHLPQLIKSAKTWTVKKHEYRSVLLVSTATMTALPDHPAFAIKENAAGSVSVEQVDADDWSEEQKALAFTHVFYLFATAFKSYVRQILIDL